ncbi:Phosphotransferase enzyme family protein [compost metagenome]
MHRTTLSEVPEYINGIKQGLVAKISGTVWLKETEKEEVLRHLDTLPEEDKLCHLDFHPENVLMGEKPYIIDWTTCGVGSPLADVARTIIMMKYGSSPSEMPKWVSMLSGYAGNKIQQAYVKEYMRLSGSSIRDIDRWIVPMASARLVEGIPDTEKEVLVALIRKILKQHVA